MIEVSYITGDADIDALYKRNERISLMLEVHNDNEIVFMEPN